MQNLMKQCLFLKNYFMLPGFFQTFLNNESTGGPEKQQKR